MPTITITFKGDSVVVDNGKHFQYVRFKEVKDEGQRALAALAEFLGYNAAELLDFSGHAHRKKEE